MYLISIKYENDAERKRLEYVFEKWADKLNISKPEGMVAIISEKGDVASVRDFIKDLLSRASRVSSENFSIFKLEPTSLDIEKGEKEFNLDIHENRDTIEKFINFIMAKQKAVIKSVSDKPFIRYYEVTTKKGTAEIRVILHEKKEMINVHIKISGYGEVAEFIHDKLKEELKYFGA